MQRYVKDDNLENIFVYSYTVNLINVKNKKTSQKYEQLMKRK